MVAVLVPRRGALGHAGEGGVVAEEAEGADRGAETSDVVGVPVEGQRVVPACGHAGLSSVLREVAGRAQSHAAVGRRVRKGRLVLGAVRHAPSR